MQNELRLHPGASNRQKAGAWFESHKNYACATQEYRAATKAEPQSAQHWLLLGASLSSAGALKEAESSFRHATSIAPEGPQGHELLASLLDQLRRADEAETEWKTALNLNRNSVVALHGLAQHLLARGNYAGAVKLLQDAPVNNEAIALDLINAYGKGGSLLEAENTAKKALEQLPSSFPLTQTLAGILVDLGKFKEAISLTDEFATAHHENLAAQRLLLHLLFTGNDLERAKPVAQTLLSRLPLDPFVLYVNGTLERQAGNYAGARTHLERSIALDPSLDDAHYNLGLALSKLNDRAGARKEFEKSLALADHDPEVHFQLSRVLRSLGEQDKADKQLQLFRDATEEQSRRSVAQSKAIAAEKELTGGDANKAVTLYNEALQETPDDALLDFKLAMALDKTGDTKAERVALEKAVQIDPAMAIAQNQLGYLAVRSGDSATAEEHFRDAVRAAPAYAEAWVNLAATLAMESKIPEAQRAVESALKADPDNANAIQLQKELSSESH